jgi:hypothetical protein
MYKAIYKIKDEYVNYILIKFKDGVWEASFLHLNM